MDIASGGRNGLVLAVSESKEIFAGTKMVKDQEIVQNLMQKLALEEDLVVVGLKEVVKALQSGGAVEKVIVARELDDMPGEDVLGAVADGFDEKLGDDVDLSSALKILIVMAEQVGAEVEIVEVVTSETHVFVNGLGGAAAILRYALPIEFFGADDHETQDAQDLVDEQQDADEYEFF
eukprot:TRINITY_DN2624_c0_g1_i3.p2 TRINITY_DN2624_c0_g1~~TRINITY_DN2624_c0_g1_i3.p2  ORF type:complete len:178 (+),score=64.51 TRINITY_DN2624_c0_g1_i3:763-1296(+)